MKELFKELFLRQYLIDQMVVVDRDNAHWTKQLKLNHLTVSQLEDCLLESYS